MFQQKQREMWTSKLCGLSLSTDGGCSRKEGSVMPRSLLGLHPPPSVSSGGAVSEGAHPRRSRAREEPGTCARGVQKTQEDLRTVFKELEGFVFSTTRLHRGLLCQVLGVCGPSLCGAPRLAETVGRKVTKAGQRALGGRAVEF